MPFREDTDPAGPHDLRLAKATMPAEQFWEWMRQHPPVLERTRLPPDVELHDLLYIKGEVIFILPLAQLPDAFAHLQHPRRARIAPGGAR